MVSMDDLMTTTSPDKGMPSKRGKNSIGERGHLIGKVLSKEMEDSHINPAEVAHRLFD